MKYTLVSVITIFLLSFSCTKDKNDSLDNHIESTKTSESTFLPKKITYIDYDSPYLNSEIDFKYQSNKLVSLFFNSIYSTDIYKFTYTGDLITKLEAFTINQNSEEIKTSETIFQYIDNKLSVVLTYYSYSSVEKTVYEHVSENEIHFKFYNVYDDTNEEILDSKQELLLENGNITRQRVLFESHVDEDDVFVVNKYDSKNSPFKNILGFHAIAGHIKLNIDFDESVNNFTKSKIYDKEESTDDIGELIVEATYINSYNTLNYPINKYIFISTKDELGEQYTYEY